MHKSGYYRNVNRNDFLKLRFAVYNKNFKVLD